MTGVHNTIRIEQAIVKLLAPKQCGENMEHLTCGPDCPETCVSVLGGGRPVCTGACREGCFCISGYVFDGNGCVKPGDCGCLVDGTYVTVRRRNTPLRQYCNAACISPSDIRPPNRSQNFS